MQNISELRDRVAMLPTLEKRMTSLSGEIQKAREEVSALLWQYEQESRDVEMLQKESLSTFILRTFGKYEAKLEKERREEIAAKLSYDHVSSRLDMLKEEEVVLKNRITDLRREAQIYKEELENRRRVLTVKFSDPDGARYAELESERQAIISQMTEIKEALSAAARARSTAQSALASLGSAESWATFDAFTRGGIFSHMAKYSHIDNAEKCFHTLESQLHHLKSELSDVHGLSISALGSISSTQRTVDFWLDNIFTDLSVRGKIRDNATEIRRLLSGITSVRSLLNDKLSEQEARLAENRRRQEELLVSIDE